MSEIIPLIPEMPVYTLSERNKELGRSEVAKVKAFSNTLSVQLNRLMNHFGYETADLHRGTGISYSTLSGWTNGDVETQLLDANIKVMARFLGVSVDYLAYSTPMTERDFEVECALEEKEDKGKSA